MPLVFASNTLDWVSRVMAHIADTGESNPAYVEILAGIIGDVPHSHAITFPHIRNAHLPPLHTTIPPSTVFLLPTSILDQDQSSWGRRCRELVQTPAGQAEFIESLLRGATFLKRRSPPPPTPERVLGPTAWERILRDDEV